MDGKKVLEAISIYRKFFAGTPKTNFPHNRFVHTNYQALTHCHGMLDDMERFVAEGKMEKVFRWLGFIQGCLWSLGYYDLEELKSHNRPNTDSEDHITRGQE